MAEWDRQETASQFLARADKALYEAKERGRGRVVVLPEIRGRTGPEPAV